MGFFSRFRRGARNRIRGEASVLELGDVDPDTAQRLRDLIDAVESDPDRIKGAHVIRTFTSTSMGPAMIDGEPFDPDNPKHVEFMRLAEAGIGIDLDGDGVVSEAPDRMPPPPPPPPPPAFPPPDVDEDPLERVQALERLAALRDSGALTEAEFDAEKARLLGDD